MSLFSSLKKIINRGRLKEELAGPTVTGVRQILSGHPAQGLTPERLTALLREAEAGDATAYLELAEEMEEKDPHYRSVISTRKLQVAGLPISVEAPTEDVGDVKAADLVRDFINTGVLQESLQDIMDALGKGFSACEIMWKTEGRSWHPSAIVWRDPRWFIFDQADGTTLRLRGEHGLPEPLEPAKFIIHTPRLKSGLPIRGGLARAVAWCYLFKNFDIKSWVQFAEVFGFPLRLGRYDSGATEEDKRVLLRAVRNISRDAAAMIPEGMRIEFVETDARGNVTLFEGLANFLDKQVSKLVLGQTGTTDTGQHVGTANAHEKVREDISKSDAVQLSATLNRDLVRPLVDLNLGPRQRYPVLRIAAEEKEDIAALMDLVVKGAGIAEDFVEVSWLRDKIGAPEPAPGAATVGLKKLVPPEQMLPAKAAQSIQGHAAVLAEDTIDRAVDAELDGWEPLVSPLAAPILELAARCESYEEFLAGLPGIVAAQDVEPLAKALSVAMMEERVKGESDG